MGIRGSTAGRHAIPLLLALLCASAHPGQAQPLPAVARLQVVLKAYVDQPEVLDFYDYRTSPAPLDLTKLKAEDGIVVPATAWPRNETLGFPAFLAALDELRSGLDQAGETERSATASALCDLLDQYPFLKVQAFDGGGDNRLPGPGAYAGIRNTFFSQYMSRWLLLTLADLRPSGALKSADFCRSAFPETSNGRAAAALYRRHQVLMFTIAVPWTPEVAFPVPQYEAVSATLDEIPRHLLAGRNPSEQLHSVTAHGGYYSREADDYHRLCLPDSALGAKWLADGAWRGGNQLNIFVGRDGSPETDVGWHSFRSGPDEGRRLVRESAFLAAFAHELTHWIDYTRTVRRPELWQQQLRLLDLGLAEGSSVRGVDCDKWGAQFPCEFFKSAPQEALASFSNVFYTDPQAFADWAVSSARADPPRLEPLNYLLHAIDTFSLDENYHETGRSFWLSAQPTGARFTRDALTLERDEQGRVTSVRSESGCLLDLHYRPDGWAEPVGWRRPPRGPVVLLCARHNSPLPPPDYLRSLPGADVRWSDQPPSDEQLGDVDLLYLSYIWGEPFAADEISAIQRYVARGGGLFIETLGWVLAVYRQIGEDANTLNKLCAPFGLRFRADAAQGERNTESTGIAGVAAGWEFTPMSFPRPELLPGVRRVVTWGQASSVDLREPGFAVVSCRGAGGAAAIVAGSEYGKGRVVAMQPSGYYTPELWHLPGPDAPDNARAVDALVTWLLADQARPDGPR